MRKLYLKLLLSVFLFCAQMNFAQSFSQNFDDITTLSASGWVMQNNSSPVGSLSWFQGTSTTATPTPGPFNSFNGAANSYIAVNFNSTGSTGTISNWLMTPNRTLRNGDVFTFYTRKPTIGGGQTDYPDRLEVRMSTNGASTNVGAGATAVGDFTTVLLSINPTLVANVYPQVWTKFTITISGLAAPTSGRIAFRYFVTGAGSLGTNSDYIGIDQVDYTPYVCQAFAMTPSGSLANAQAGVAYTAQLTQTGALGAPNFMVTTGALPPGLSLSAAGTISGTPTATGTFNFTVTVNDASGCSGSAGYSITSLCRSNVATLSDFPVLCTNSAIYTLSEGFPAGGTYSGTGVTGGQFDPAVGTQAITYTYTDPYGCTYSVSKTIVVNPAITITAQPTGSTLCSGGSTQIFAAASNATGYQWQVDSGAGFTDITNSGIYSGASTSTLTITGAPASLNGSKYRMVATGLCEPAISNSAVLAVKSAPAITAQPGAKTVCAGAATTFSATVVNATGYWWQVDQGAGFTNISNGGIYSGVTSASLNITGVTTSMNGYVYRLIATGTCTPAAATNTAVLTVSSTSAPTGQATQSFNAGDALSALTVNGSNIKWYASAVDAALHQNELPAQTLIVNNTTYYATQTLSGCESTSSLAVLAYNVSLGTEQAAGHLKIQIYPNPARETVAFTGNAKISRVVIISADGRKAAEKTLNADRKINIQDLTQGIYLLQIFTDEGIQTVKLIKK